MQKSSINRQRGSIIIPVAVSLIVGLILLGGVQLGYYFFMKRELQNTADLAALSAVQLIEETGELTCDDEAHPAQKAAKAMISENFKYGTLLTQSVLCGVWDPVKYAEVEGHFKEAKKEDEAEGEGDNVEYNAIQVALTYEAPGFMPFSTDATITAKAIAKKGAMPVAVFSVGPSLLKIDDGALNDTLSAVGLNLLGTSIGSFKGLADVKIKTSGLLGNILGPGKLDTAVTVADLNKLLDAEVGLGEIMLATVKAADPDGVIDLELLKSIGVQLDSLTIPLGSIDGNGRGLFAYVEAPSAKAALDTMVSVGDILDVVLGVATQERAIDLPLNINLGLLKVEAKVGVIEPPSLGIGGPGTTAYSASVRAFLRLCVDLVGCDSPDNALLGLKVDIPIGIEAVTGEAILGPMCEKTKDGNPIAEITTISKVLSLCVGDITGKNANDVDANDEDAKAKNVFSTEFSCANPNLKPKNIASLGLLGLNFQPPPIKLPLNVLSRTEKDDYIEGQVNYTENDLDLSGTVTGLVSALFGEEATDNSAWDESMDGQTLWDDALNALPETEKCNPEAGGEAGYACRIKIRTKVLEGIQKGLGENKNGVVVGGLVGELTDGVLKDALKGGLLKTVGDLVSGLIINVVDLLKNLLELLLAGKLPGDDCARAKVTVLTLSITYTGSESFCIDQINKVLDEMKNSEVQDNGGPVPALLALITGLLEPLLAMLGGEDGVLTKLLTTLGLEVNNVRTELISLDCNSAAQLVY